MRGVEYNRATLDHADFRYADFSPAEPSKPSAAPAQPPSGAASPTASAQEMLQALTTALAAQQPSQPTDPKPTCLKYLVSAKKTDFTGATMTRVEFDGSNLAGAIFDTSDVSGASMANVTFGQYPMPAKPEAKKLAKAAVRRLAKQLGKATVAAAMEAAGDDDDDDNDGDDDDDQQKEDSKEAHELLASMAKKGVERFASAVANAVPQVIAACQKADQAIDDAVTEAKNALDDDSRALEGALEEAFSASTDRTTATAAVEGLMQQALGALLDAVFSEAGTLLDKAKKELVDAAADAPGKAGTLIQDGAELGLPHVLKLLRSSVEKHADPLLKRLAAGVAQEIGGRFVPAAATRLRSPEGPSAKISVSDATEQLLDSPATVYRTALHTLLDGVSACLDDPSAVAQQWLLQQGGKFLQGSGGLANLGTRAKAFQEELTSKLSADVRALKVLKLDGKAPGEQFNTHVRSQIAKRALAGASRYAATGHVAMLNLVLSTDPLALTKDEKELTYVLEKLGKLEDADVTSELWQDYYESWASFLALRSKLQAECAQHIFDAIATDESVLTGLAAAHLFTDAVIKSGQVPNELLLQLKQGPAKHIKNQAYAYRHKVQLLHMLRHLCTCTCPCT